MFALQYEREIEQLRMSVKVLKSKLDQAERANGNPPPSDFARQRQEAPDSDSKMKVIITR